MKILVETRDQQATQNDRQADAARYINELNSVRCHIFYENPPRGFLSIISPISSGLMRL